MVCVDKLLRVVSVIIPAILLKCIAYRRLPTSQESIDQRGSCAKCLLQQGQCHCINLRLVMYLLYTHQQLITHKTQTDMIPSHFSLLCISFSAKSALQVAQKAAEKAKKDDADKQPVVTKDEPDAEKVRPALQTAHQTSLQSKFLYLEILLMSVRRKAREAAIKLTCMYADIHIQIPDCRCPSEYAVMLQLLSILKNLHFGILTAAVVDTLACAQSTLLSHADAHSSEFFTVFMFVCGCACTWTFRV